MDPLLTSIAFILLVVFVIIIVLWSFWGDNKNFPKWPSLILFLLGIIPLIITINEFITILNCPNQSPRDCNTVGFCSSLPSDYAGIIIWIFTPIALYLFLFSFAFRKLNFVDFFRKETYKNNIKKIFLKTILYIIAMIIIFATIIYILATFINPLLKNCA